MFLQNKKCRKQEEENNKEFVIEASKDGKTFHNIGTVASAAKDGNSDTELEYNFSKSWSEAATMLGFPIAMILAIASLGASAYFTSKRKKFALFALLFIGVSIFTFSCRKNNDLPLEDVDVYIKIGQVDIDGTTSYSPVVKAIQK